ncbi:hypothetical protein quinque_003298 [Culex quinquefasciatus]
MADTAFSFNVPLGDRLEQLVNSEYGADVFFKVGEAGELMFAHKIIITTASEVFYAQLNGKFEEATKNTRTDPIAIKDINSTIFLEILRFMYCEKVNLNGDNLVEVNYAAKKYLLSKLVDICDKFIQDKIKEENVLKIFNDNRRYEFVDINTICLRVICDNPLECFDQKLFLALELGSLKLIVDSPGMNCHDDQLVMKGRNCRELHCQKLHAFSKFSYSDTVVTDITIEVSKPFNLYGFGILIGTESTDIQSLKLNVEVKVEFDDEWENCFSTEVVVPVKQEEVYVYEVVFKKIIMEEHGMYRIVVKKMMKNRCQKCSIWSYLNQLAQLGRIGWSCPIPMKRIRIACRIYL